MGIRKSNRRTKKINNRPDITLVGNRKETAHLHKIFILNALNIQNIH